VPPRAPTRATAPGDELAQAAADLAVTAADVPLAPAFALSDPFFGGLAVEPLSAVDVALEDPDEELALAPPSASFFPDDPPELYPSAYHPPPLRMKPAPPETCRRAVRWAQTGQVSSAGSLIRCSASHSWWQLVQKYS